MEPAPRGTPPAPPGSGGFGLIRAGTDCLRVFALAQFGRRQGMGSPEIPMRGNSVSPAG